MADELDPKSLEDFESLLSSLHDDISVLGIITNVEGETDREKDSLFVFTMKQLQRKAAMLCLLTNEYAEGKGVYTDLNDPVDIKLPITSEDFFKPKN